MPFIALGDLNITPEELQDSGWLSILDARYKLTPHPTSTKSSPNRHIDMCLYSIAIQHVILSLGIDLTVPWGPHYGMLLKIAATPLAIKGRVFVIPKTLPLKEFNEKWNTISDFSKLQAWRTAQNKARKIL